MIVINRRKDGFIITGHAGYAEPGKDIVCAAVSALVQAFIASVEELTQDKIEHDYRRGTPDYGTRVVRSAVSTSLILIIWLYIFINKSSVKSRQIRRKMHRLARGLLTICDVFQPIACHY